MKHIDLFSGIGGFTLGLAPLTTTVQFVEIDKRCQKVLAKHFPDVPIHEDITTFKGFPCDIITGGFPCQDISVAGTRKGLSGERSGLWSEFNRVIKESNPKYVIIENSPNLRNLGLEVVLKDLWESGYDAEWYCLEAGQFGAAHVRERLIIIAYPACSREQVLVSNESFEKIKKAKRCSRKDLSKFFKYPFGRSDSWPQPLLRRGDDGVRGRVDRLKQVGNSVYVPLIQFLRDCIYKEEHL